MKNQPDAITVQPNAPQELTEARLQQECVMWTGAINSKGYGVLRVGPRTWLAHRHAYFTANGEIPKGQLVCHSCDTPKCINPNHLFLGTSKVNSNDMASKGRHRAQKQTHCVNGHAFTPENTRLIKGKHRCCIACHRRRAAEQRARNRQSK